MLVGMRLLLLFWRGRAVREVCPVTVGVAVRVELVEFLLERCMRGRRRFGWDG